VAGHGKRALRTKVVEGNVFAVQGGVATLGLGDDQQVLSDTDQVHSSDRITGAGRHHTLRLPHVNVGAYANHDDQGNETESARHIAASFDRPTLMIRFVASVRL